MKSIRNANGWLRGNLVIVAALAAVLITMVPVIAAISTAGTATHSAEAANDGNKPYTKVIAGNAIYEPNAGKTNVFGPGGIFPFFNDTFACGNALSCGVNVDGSRFIGVFKEGGGAPNKFAADYVAPITYGDQQIKGHHYRVQLVDTYWNSTDSAMPTRQAQFLIQKGGVAFHQLQHGHSNVDRSDVPLFFNDVALYGHVNVYDETQGGKLVASDIFAHMMVGKVVDEKKAFENLQLTPATQTVVALFVVNIPSGVKLPGGIGPLTPAQAQSFTPLSSDQSLTSIPPVNYSQLATQGSLAQPPLSQSTTLPVDNPKQPVFFTFLLFTDTRTAASDSPGFLDLQ